MKARYYLWGALGGLAVSAAPGSALWVLPGIGLVAHMVFDERPELVREAWPQLAAASQRIQLAAPAALRLPTMRPAAARPPVARPEGRASGGAPTGGQASGGELFESLEATPHRLIIGHTRGGKTTLIHHMATSWAAQGARVLVADPDAAPGLWPRCEVAGAGDDLASISVLLDQVAAEVESRRQRRKQGVRTFEPLHLVIDEAQDVLPDIPGALDLFETVARRGGKLGIRMTVGVQDKQVKTLGLEGKSEVLRNLQVADVLKTRDGRRVAVLRDAETGQKVQLAIPQLLDPESLITPPAPVASPPVAPVARPAPAPLDLLDLLDLLLAQPVTSASQSHGNTQGVTVTVPRADGNGNGNTHAQVTVTPQAGGPEVRIYAQAIADGGRARRRPGRGLDMRARRVRAQQQRQASDLQRAYVEARRSGVSSFRQAYAQLGGNRAEALAAWQAGQAGGTP